MRPSISFKMPSMPTEPESIPTRETARLLAISNWSRTGFGSASYCAMMPFSYMNPSLPTFCFESFFPIFMKKRCRAFSVSAISRESCTDSLRAASFSTGMRPVSSAMSPPSPSFEGRSVFATLRSARNKAWFTRSRFDSIAARLAESAGHLAKNLHFSPWQEDALLESLDQSTRLRALLNEEHSPISPFSVESAQGRSAMKESRSSGARSACGASRVSTSLRTHR